MKQNYYLLLFFLLSTIFCPSCGPDVEALTPLDVKEFKKGYFERLSTLSKENKLSHYIDFNKDYYIVSNVKDPYDARVVLFGDRHDSADLALDFFHFGTDYLQVRDVALFEANSDVLKNNFAKFYDNAHIYVLSTIIPRERVFKLSKEFNAMEKPSEAIELFLVRQEDAMRKSLSLYKSELHIEKSIWHEVISDGWDAQELIDDENPMKNSHQRNQKMADSINKYIAQKKRILLLAGGYHIPHYQIAYSKTLLLQETKRSPLVEKMLASKSVDEFFKLCLSLPEGLRKRSHCDATLAVWEALKNSSLGFAMIMKKRPEQTYENIHGGFEEFSIIREKELVPNEL